MSIELRRLAEPFPAADIEWRIARSGVGKDGVFALVIAYITARAIQERLDSVCGPENWRVEEPRIIELKHEKGTRSAFAVGISIRIGEEWLTKWDVSEPTNIEAAKGGFSGAMKRAGAQWGIGRYLYHLDETFAETTDDRQRGSGWNYATLPKHDNRVYYWKAPTLPEWALPKESETSISADELNTLKKAWKEIFAPYCDNRAELADGFKRFVVSVVGEFPMADASTWTRDALNRCRERIEKTTDPSGVSSDIPFDAE